MRLFWILLKKELHAFFVSPVAYVVLALAMVLNGFAFRAALSVLESAPSEGSIVSWTFHAMWFWLSYFFIFPLLTMRLFSEEKKLGTLETLFTAPVRAWQVVGAKYLASVIVYCVLWLPSLFNFKFAHWISAGQVELPPGAIAGAYIILVAMGMFNLAVGCFASALTSNQIVAAIISFTLSLLHFLLGVFIMVVGHKISDTIVEVVNYFAATEHIRIFTAGLIDSRPIIYYLSMSLLFLSFTHHVVEFRRWRP
ncbi:ABC transporter permease [Prosthecobacter vanneervenii]|uniref:ABC-2 type transport system permease protein n=1 Tax=Prosthecobacter vanneervenii TaxID=48466 RepID=A0A7W7Y994_9BACT|nr:ABC transporter permease [Prosthecobacter vanneervenii]MBB5031946.1 ABC-2 type transport system permease protein [Prosthecobacter vanneervenii]